MTIDYNVYPYYPHHEVINYDDVKDVTMSGIAWFLMYRGNGYFFRTRHKADLKLVEKRSVDMDYKFAGRLYPIKIDSVRGICNNKVPVWLDEVEDSIRTRRKGQLIDT